MQIEELILDAYGVTVGVNVGVYVLVTNGVTEGGGEVGLGLTTVDVAGGKV